MLKFVNSKKYLYICIVNKLNKILLSNTVDVLGVGEIDMYT